MGHVNRFFPSTVEFPGGRAQQSAGIPWRASVARLEDVGSAEFLEKLLNDAGASELHPLLHEYARMRLHSLPEQEQHVFVRHVAYFGQSIGGAYQSAVNEGHGADAYDALNVFDRERDNVELAQVRVLAAGFPDPQLAVEVTDDLTRVWRLRNEPRLLAWLTHALALATTTKLIYRQAKVRQAIGDVQSFR